MNQAKGLLVVLIVLVLTAAGCSPHHQGRPGSAAGPSAQEVVPEVKQLVDENVKDPAKAREVHAVIQDIMKEVRKSAQKARGYHEQLAALNTDYTATPEQFTKILDELNNARMESAAKILQLRFKAKELLTPEEWKNLNLAMIKARRQYDGTPAAMDERY
jgi:uncharacterized coiled-coil DUF342 family protein